jgi:hypothetical protein
VTPDVHITASSRRAARLLQQQLEGYDVEIERDGESWQVIARNPGGRDGDVRLLFQIAEAARDIVADDPDVELHILDEGRRVRLPPEG